MRGLVASRKDTPVMAYDATQAQVADVSSRLYVAAVGTALPTTIAGAFTGFEDIGVIKETPELANEIEEFSIAAWNSLDPIRSGVKARKLSWNVTLGQVTTTALKMWLGLVTVTSITGGSKVVPGASGPVEFAMGAEFTDGSKKLRIMAQRVSAKPNGNITFPTDDVIQLPVTLSIVKPSSGDTWTILTDFAGVV